MRGSTLVAAALVVSLVTSACGERDCQDVAEDLIATLQDVLDQAAELRPADLQTPDGQLPTFLLEVQEDGERLAQEATDLGCTDAQMQDLVAERLDTLEAEPGTVADLLLDLLTRGDFFDGGPTG